MGLNLQFLASSSTLGLFLSFGFEVTCDNLKDEQFGLLLLLIESFSKHGRLGHSASRGLGKLEVVIEKVADLKDVTDFLKNETKETDYAVIREKYVAGALNG